MRSLLKISMAAAAVFAFVAGSALAQDKPELKWNGNIGAGFGLYSGGDKDSSTYGNTASSTSLSSTRGASEYATSFEANLRATVGTDTAFSVLRFRPKGTNSGQNGTNTWTSGNYDLYGEFYWKPVAELQVMFGRLQGPAWSNPRMGSYLINNPVGAQEYWMNWTGLNGLDIEYNAGAIQAGLGLASECRPSCGYSTSAGLSTVSSQGASNSTMAPHITATFGDIQVNAMLPSTSGSTVQKDTLDATGAVKTAGKVITVGGSGMDIGVGWKSGAMGAALDIQSFTDTATDAQKAGRLKDLSRSAMGFKVDAMGFQLAYHTLTFGALAGSDVCGPNKGPGCADFTNTFMKIAYFIPVGAGSVIVPEYTTATLGQQGTIKSGATDGTYNDRTNTLIRIVGNTSF